MSLTFGIYIHHLGLSLYLYHGIVHLSHEQKQLALAWQFLVFNLNREKRNPCINRGKNTAIVLRPTQQNVKRLWTVFSASILVELIKVFLAGRKMQMLTKSMHPAAKSTDTSEQIWLISQTGNTYTRAHVYAHSHTETNLWYTVSLWPSCSIWSRRGQRK